jgi:hypothetical protein
MSAMERLPGTWLIKEEGQQQEEGEAEGGRGDQPKLPNPLHSRILLHKSSGKIQKSDARAEFWSVTVSTKAPLFYFENITNNQLYLITNPLHARP